MTVLCHDDQCHIKERSLQAGALMRGALGWGPISLSLHAVREDETKDPEGEVTLALGCAAGEQGARGMLQEAGHRWRSGVPEQ